MGVVRIDHIGVAVSDLQEALKVYRDGFGMGDVHLEEVPEQGVRVAVFHVGESRIELLSPLSPDTPVGKFLESRGPGVHHVALGVENLGSMLEELKSKGFRLIDEQPKVGAGGAAIAFVHPRSTLGTLIELCERPKDKG
ncbi:MAG TPA: methylmalonyl-CoA epimerase [Clostridia bacterium]|nr:methylmalonyl-CoA epimerase [Clostridia bacterium]